VWARLRALNLAADLISQRQLRVIRGNHVFELIPNVPAPRASAIRAVRRALEQRADKPVFVVYVNEDVSDDDTFDTLGREAITIAVGGRAPRAHYHLASPSDVVHLITRLAGAARVG
jgi:trehalose-phosphatase